MTDKCKNLVKYGEWGRNVGPEDWVKKFCKDMTSSMDSPLLQLHHVISIVD